MSSLYFIQISVKVNSLWKEVATDQKCQQEDKEFSFPYSEWVNEHPAMFTAYSYNFTSGIVIVCFQKIKGCNEEQIMTISSEQILQIQPQHQIQNFFQNIFNIAPSAAQLKQFTGNNENCKVNKLNIKCIKQLLQELKQIYKQNEFQDKVGVMLQLNNVTDEETLFSCKNEQQTEDFKYFLQILGQIVEMKDFASYNGGLDIKGRESAQSIYHKQGMYETMFHVCPMIKYTEGDTQQVARKRHIGNDHLVIIYQDSDECKFSSDMIRIKKGNEENSYNIKIIAKQYINCDNVEYKQTVQGSLADLQQYFHKLLLQCHKAAWSSGELQQKLIRLKELKIQDCSEGRMN